MFLVEGYMDVVSMYQSGIINTVASSGTSLTQDQVRLIKRYTSNLTIIYDGDAAGIKAALRGLDIALEEGLNVKVVLLPDGDDPDTFVQKRLRYVTSIFRKRKERFNSFTYQFILEEAGGDPVKSSRCYKDIVQTISLIPDPITRSLYIKQTSKLLEVTESVLVNETNKILRKRIVKDYRLMISRLWMQILFLINPNRKNLNFNSI